MANVSSSNGLEKRPKLRFPGFDEPYKQCRIGDIYAERSQRGASDMELLSVTMNDGVKPRSEIEGKDNSSEDKSNYKIVRKGDMVYNSMRMWQGANGISPCDGIVSPAYTVLMPKQEINNGYFAALFKSVTLINEFRKNSQGMTSDTWNLKYPQIETIKVQIPSVCEQDKVSELFSVLDERIVAQSQLVESLKKYKRGVVSKVFSEIERECSTIRLGDYVSIHRGGSPRPIDAYITDDTDGINWIKIGDTSADDLYITRTREKIVPSGAKKSRRVFQGDLILSNSMSFGRPYILQIDGCIHDGWLLIRDENNVFEKRFLCYYLGSDNVIAQYKRFAAGSCVNNLNSELVGNVEICCPPYRTQQKIANMLTVLDSRIDHASRTHVALLRIRTSLLQQLFI